MFTVDSLLELAQEYETLYKALLLQFPPGTYNENRNLSCERMNHALTCAAWMDKNGHEQLRFVGPFGRYDLKSGDQVRIKAGSLFFSTHPKTPKQGELLKRAQTVTIRGSVSAGYVFDGEVYQPKLNWAGTGGYWRWTDLNNIECPDSRKQLSGLQSIKTTENHFHLAHV